MNEAILLLEALGLKDFSSVSSQKMGENGAKISGGQKQRLAIARALFRKPQVLFLDEATSAMDYNTQKNVLETIMRSMKGKTVIMITDRQETFFYFDKIMQLPNAKIIKQKKNA